MAPTFLQIILLGLIQGAAELLPVSSSAHVIVVEKLMRLDPASPEMTFLLVMLHTGTMLAVIVYFWRAWREGIFASQAQFTAAARQIVIATVATLVLGGALKLLIEKVILGGGKAEIEHLFSSLPLIGTALLAAGVVILWSARRARSVAPRDAVSDRSALWIGLAQGVCIPFRGLSRSGVTISVGLLQGVAQKPAEVFSFALAVVITPLAIAWEAHRLLKVHPEVAHADHLLTLLRPGLIGLCASFAAGLLALVWLSAWLEHGRWHRFGYYCVAAAVVVYLLAARGF
ncbi:MAG: undecaprenyl-diphosphate phosphatase [Opitutales bacterium]